MTKMEERKKDLENLKKVLLKEEVYGTEFSLCKEGTVILNLSEQGYQDYLSTGVATVNSTKDEGLPEYAYSAICVIAVGGIVKEVSNVKIIEKATVYTKEERFGTDWVKSFKYSVQLENGVEKVIVKSGLSVAKLVFLFTEDYCVNIKDEVGIYSVDEDCYGDSTINCAEKYLFLIAGELMNLGITKIDDIKSCINNALGDGVVIPTAYLESSLEGVLYLYSGYIVEKDGYLSWARKGDSEEWVGKFKILDDLDNQFIEKMKGV